MSNKPTILLGKLPREVRLAIDSIQLVYHCEGDIDKAKNFLSKSIEEGQHLMQGSSQDVDNEVLDVVLWNIDKLKFIEEYIVNG